MIPCIATVHVKSAWNSLAECTCEVQDWYDVKCVRLICAGASLTQRIRSQHDSAFELYAKDRCASHIWIPDRTGQRPMLVALYSLR